VIGRMITPMNDWLRSIRSGGVGGRSARPVTEETIEDEKVMQREDGRKCISTMSVHSRLRSVRWDD